MRVTDDTRANGRALTHGDCCVHVHQRVKAPHAGGTMDVDAYAAVKANDYRALQRRLREAESSFPVNVGARNGAGLMMLHVGVSLCCTCAAW